MSILNHMNDQGRIEFQAGQMPPETVLSHEMCKHLSFHHMRMLSVVYEALLHADSYSARIDIIVTSVKAAQLACGADDYNQHPDPTIQSLNGYLAVLKSWQLDLTDLDVAA